MCVLVKLAGIFINCPRFYIDLRKIDPIPFYCCTREEINKLQPLDGVNVQKEGL